LGKKVKDKLFRDLPALDKMVKIEGRRFRAIDLPPTISFLAIHLAGSLSLIVGIISGVYPAIKAADLNLVDVLRYE
jgi:ABC-type antimicrobial peptide transport system permease subunit